MFGFRSGRCRLKKSYTFISNVKCFLRPATSHPNGIGYRFCVTVAGTSVSLSILLLYTVPATVLFYAASANWNPAQRMEHVSY
ncbi:hypothetical protein LCGC14_1951110, partial [marine sediment metagenome]